MGGKQGKEEKKENKVENNKGGNKEDKKEEKKKKKDEAGPSSVVKKLDIHCEGCALKIKKSVRNFEGVGAVASDLANSKLTVIRKVDPWMVQGVQNVDVDSQKVVKGTMDVATLPLYLKDNLKRSVEIAPGGGGGRGGKKEKGVNGGGGKEKKGKGGGDGGVQHEFQV